MTKGFTDRDVADQSGRTFLVTGANTGLGFEAAKALAGKGARVLLGCRSQAKAESAMDQIRQDVADADLAFIPLDQADLGSVKKAAALVNKEPRLDVLINNAGIMVPPYELTKDGFESQFGVNHLGTFALTGLLLNKLAEQDNSRVVITSSLAHRSGKILFDDINAERDYSAMKRYSQSKLANMMFMHELNRRLTAAQSSTIAVACHPGIATTELSRHLPMLIQKTVMPVLGLLMNNPKQGAWPTLMAATADEVVGGDYCGPKNIREVAGPAIKVRSTYASRNEDKAKRLWDLSVDMTGVDPGI